jgi:hypothetical protein
MKKNKDHNLSRDLVILIASSLPHLDFVLRSQKEKRDENESLAPHFLFTSKPKRKEKKIDCGNIIPETEKRVSWTTE